MHPTPKHTHKLKTHTTRKHQESDITMILEPDPIAARDQIQIVSSINSVPYTLQNDFSKFYRTGGVRTTMVTETNVNDIEALKGPYSMSRYVSGFAPFSSTTRGMSQSSSTTTDPNLSSFHLPTKTDHHHMFQRFDGGGSSSEGSTAMLSHLFNHFNQMDQRGVAVPESLFAEVTTMSSSSPSSSDFFPPIMEEIEGFHHDIMMSPSSSLSSNNKKKNNNNKTSSVPAVRLSEFQQVKWMERFRALCEYKKKHGDCNVSVAGIHSKDDIALALWVKRVRHQYNLFQRGQHSSLTPERLELLEGIGFRWKVHDDSWQERFCELQMFYKQHGHVRVPLNEETACLHSWIKRQRSQYTLYLQGKATVMSDDRCRKLRDIGLF